MRRRGEKVVPEIGGSASTGHGILATLLAVDHHHLATHVLQGNTTRVHGQDTDIGPVGVTVLLDIQTAQLVLKVMASGLARHHQALPNPLAQAVHLIAGQDPEALVPRHLVGVLQVPAEDGVNHHSMITTEETTGGPGLHSIATGKTWVGIGS